MYTREEMQIFESVRLAAYFPIIQKKLRFPGLRSRSPTVGIQPLEYVRVDSLGKTVMLGKIEGRRRRGRQRMRWLDGTPTRWTWVWAGSRRWWRKGKLGILQSMGSQRVRHDWATELRVCQWWGSVTWTTTEMNSGGSHKCSLSRLQFLQVRKLFARFNVKF